MNPDEGRQRREFRRIGARGSSAVWRAKEKKAGWMAAAPERSLCSLGVCTHLRRTAILSLSDCGRRSPHHTVRCGLRGRSLDQAAQMGLYVPSDVDLRDVPMWMIRTPPMSRERDVTDRMPLPGTVVTVMSTSTRHVG
jgi:hypothetical protein